MTHHVKSQMIEREVSVHDARNIAKNGKIIKSGLDGIIIRTGKGYNNRPIEVVTKEFNSKIIIITAYYAD